MSNKELYIAMRALDTGEISVHYEVVDLPAKAKIDCHACRQIFEIAKSLKSSDFANRSK